MRIYILCWWCKTMVVHDNGWEFSWSTATYGVTGRQRKNPLTYIFHAAESSLIGASLIFKETVSETQSVDGVSRFTFGRSLKHHSAMGPQQNSFTIIRRLWVDERWGILEKLTLTCCHIGSKNTSVLLVMRNLGRETLMLILFAVWKFMKTWHGIHWKNTSPRRKYHFLHSPIELKHAKCSHLWDPF